MTDGKYRVLRRNHSVLLLGVVPVALVWLLTGAPAEAQTEPDRFQFDLFGAYLTAGGIGVEVNGLRGSVRFSDRWAVEGTLLRLDGGGVLLGDFSVKKYKKARGRTAFYFLAGAGLLSDSHFEEQVVMVHLGLGTEISLGQKVYLRPELRGHWFAEELGAVTIGDFSLGVGWRF